MKKHFPESLRRWFPTMIVLVVIVYATLSNDPTRDIDFVLIPGLDKLIHAIMFGGLSGAMAFDYTRPSQTIYPLSKRAMLVISAIAAGIGALDELAQSLLTNTREGDFYDWLADVFGIAVAYFTAPYAIKLVLRKTHVRSKESKE